MSNAIARSRKEMGSSLHLLTSKRLRKAHHHIAQSASLQRTPVGIPFYWDKGIDPPLEPRGTLNPLWSIIPDGTITFYTPHTITIDTQNRKNAVIINNDLSISKKTAKLPEPTQTKKT